MKNFSLRNRITFYFLGTTAVLILILFLTIYSVVKETVYTHLDDDLDSEAKEIFNSIVILNNEFLFANKLEWFEKEHNQIEVNPTFIEVTDSAGKILKKSGNLLSDSLNIDLSLKSKSYFDSKLSNQVTRQLQMPIQNPHGKILGYLIISIPLEESELVLNNLSMVLIIGYPIVLLALFLTTRLLAGKSIEPVNKVIFTAERITKENLEQRIELPLHKDELYKLTTTINNLLDRLGDAVLREKQFTSDASHELRTPLAAIKGTLEVLIRKPREVEHYKEKVLYCIQEINRMSNLVEQLLFLARYESGKISPMMTEINLNERIYLVLERLESLISTKQIKVNVNIDDEIVYADPSMLEVIIENIISNSVKYSENDKNLQIKTFKENGSVICSIEDEGIGMDETTISRAFDRFYRSDESRNSRTTGSGLGLAIVKKLADMQNIKLRISSKPSIGTTFYIQFPA